MIYFTSHEAAQFGTVGQADKEREREGEREREREEKRREEKRREEKRQKLMIYDRSNHFYCL